MHKYLKISIAWATMVTLLNNMQSKILHNLVWSNWDASQNAKMEMGTSSIILRMEGVHVVPQPFL